MKLNINSKRAQQLANETIAFRANNEIESINQLISTAAKNGEFECTVEIVNQYVRDAIIDTLRTQGGFKVCILTDSSFRISWYE